MPRYRPFNTLLEKNPDALKRLNKMMSSRPARLEIRDKRRQAIQNVSTPLVNIIQQCDAPFFHTLENPLEHVISPDYQRLAGVLASAARDKRIHIVLAWPVSPAVPAFIHAMITLPRYGEGDKKGLRTILWPGKISATSYLDTIYVDVSWLYEMASHWQSLRRQSEEKYVSSVCSESEQKDLLFLAFNDLREDGGNGVQRFRDHPKLSELIPIFPVGREGWGDFASKFLPRLKKQLPRSRASSIRSYCNTLGAPFTAPDAIFRIAPSKSHDECIALLNSNEFDPELDGVQPDVALFDLRYTNIQSVSNWRKTFFKLVHHLQKKMPGSPVGVVAVLDNPVYFANLLYFLHHQWKNRLTRYELLTQDAYPLVSSKRDGNLGPLPSSVKVQVLDQEASSIIQDISQTANTLGRQVSEISNDLRDLNRSLLWASGLPVGLAAYRHWRETIETQSKHWRPDILFRSTRESVERCIEKGQAGPELGRLTSLLQKADRLMQNYEIATPFGTAAQKEITSAFEFAKSISIDSCPRPLVLIGAGSIEKVSLIENILLDCKPNGKHGKRFCEVATLDGLLSMYSQTPCMSLVLLGSPGAIATIFAMRGGIERASVLYSVRSASFARDVLEIILSIEKYQPLHSLANSLLKPLQQSLEGMRNLNLLETLKSQEVDILSSMWETGLDDSGHFLAGQSHDAAFQIILDGFPAIEFQEGQTVYVRNDELSPPLRIAAIEELQPGDQLLLISPAMKEKVQAYLHDETLSKQLNETLGDKVRQYHSILKNQVQSKFPQKSMTGKIRAIRKEIQKKSPDIPVSEGMLHYWLSIESENGSDAADLRSRAARDLKTFLAFTGVLGLDEQVARFFFSTIRIFRAKKQQGGRSAMSKFYHLLFDPSVEQYMDLPEGIADQLRREAMNNLYEVIEVKGVRHAE